MRQTLKTVGMIYFFALVILLLNSGGWLTPPPEVHRLLSEVGVALLAVGSIHLLDHFSMIREVSSSIVSKSREMFDRASRESADAMTAEVAGEIKKSTETILGDVNKRTERAFAEASEILQRQVKSIKVMEKCNLVEIYPSRSEASQAIRHAMTDSNEVWLMGISLNEFCRQQEGELSRAWDALVTQIKSGQKRARLLLLDPYCHGAVLRSYSETEGRASAEDRLEGDIRGAAKLLHKIRLELKDKSPNLQVRIYRMAPTMFVCRLDTETFVQNYYFWKERRPTTPIPVLRYHKQVPAEGSICFHSELEQHFNFVWDHASIRLDTLEPADVQAQNGASVPAAHFLPLPTRGLEWGAHASGMENVFIDQRRPATRMLEEVTKSKRIWIQGITLRAFFDDSNIALALKARIKNRKDGDDIRILLLDPDCEQAKVRAYREFLLNNSANKIPFGEFARDFFEKSTLRNHILAVKKAIDEIETDCGANGIKKTYQTAPHMFVLIGDNAAFVEQYTYGKLGHQNPDKEVILGSDMPLIEYERTIDPIYIRVLDALRGEENESSELLRPRPYPLLVDHFKWAWEQASLASTPIAQNEERAGAAVI